MDISWGPCRLELAFLKDMITDRSRVGSRVRDTRKQSKHSTMKVVIDKKGTHLYSDSIHRKLPRWRSVSPP